MICNYCAIGSYWYVLYPVQCTGTLASHCVVCIMSSVPYVRTFRKTDTFLALNAKPTSTIYLLLHEMYENVFYRVFMQNLACINQPSNTHMLTKLVNCATGDLFVSRRVEFVNTDSTPTLRFSSSF